MSNISFQRQVSRWTSPFFQTDPVHWSSHTSFFPYLFLQPGKKWRELSGHGITEEYDWNICADIFLTSEFLHPGHEMSKHRQTEEKPKTVHEEYLSILMPRWTWTNITSGTRGIELFHMCDMIVFMHCIPANTKPQSCVKSWLCLNSIWFTHMPSLYPGPRGFSSQPLITRCTWGLHLVYIFSQASGCWITSSKRNTLTNTVGWLGFNFLPNCMFMLSWQLNPGGVFSLEETLPTAKPSA